MTAVTPVKVSVGDVAPETVVHETPPLVLTCQLYVNPVPPAATVKVALEPVQLVVLTGCAVIFAAVFTVSVPQLLVTAGVQVPETKQR